jgi:hypothetical protein
MTGGTGDDTFIFLRRADGYSDTDFDPDFDPLFPTDDHDPGEGNGADTITDFIVGEDTLVFLANKDFDLKIEQLNHYRLKPVGLQKGRLEVAFFKLCMLRMRFKHA